MGVFAAVGDSKLTSEAKQSSWSLLKTWKLLASDDVEDHSHASFRIKVGLFDTILCFCTVLIMHYAMPNGNMGLCCIEFMGPC